MSDDKTKRGAPDRKRINVNEDYELRYWTKKLNVSERDLRRAVCRAGSSVRAVKLHLRKKHMT